MNIGLVAAPFIPVPPRRYGGTELFLAHLAEGLVARGHEPIVYTVGESSVGCETRWRWPKGLWPIQSTLEESLRDYEHTSWACRDAAGICDVIHLNNALGLNLARFLDPPVVYTLHHPHDPALSGFYENFPEVHFAAISRRQAAAEKMPRLTTIHHGLDVTSYQLSDRKRDYLCFIGRIAPIKGVHTAIAVARKCGIPLKIGGEIQPCYQDYWDRIIAPEVDGAFIEFVGEVDLEAKNRLLGGARALLFPIEWEEPFGLVMLEAMACGTPVLAFACGAAPEVVGDGEAGWICQDLEDMARRATELSIPPQRCRAYVEREFSVERMVQAYIDLYERLALPCLTPRWRPARPRGLRLQHGRA